ncbi:MAG: DNA-binding protein WhiA [Oscillospiraceae bacterium]|nr:DNA-binding protein WhiA [Oscillospiraceae bacterium]MDD7294143.1 DNA-binding protein WhiA [Oscillospiraceae bacterium]MDY2510192.1 DNA-binding protein WhiA [Ruminococcus callidus]
MSFSQDVRQALQNTILDKDQSFSCLYGMLLYSRTFTPQRICFQSESETVAILFPKLMHTVFSFSPEAVTLERGRGGLYSLSLQNEQQIATICNRYHIHLDDRQINLCNIVQNSMPAFFAGVFLTCGSIMDPNKSYHLEFVTPTATLCNDLCIFLNQLLGIKGHILQRKQTFVLYIKDSEQIEDILTFMGAQQCTLDLMNIKIKKDMRNKANRVRNCDAANIDKVVSAAMRQTEEILWIAEKKGLDTLPPDLKALAELRLENPELSLKELGELLQPPIGRSGVNHRFQKLSLLAKELHFHAGDQTR